MIRMEAVTVTVSPKYQVVIPEAVRKAMGVHPGQRIVVFEKGDLILLVPVKKMSELAGSMPGLTSKGIRDEGERF